MAYVVLNASYPLPMRMDDVGLLQKITVNVGYADSPDAEYPSEFAGIIACERYLGALSVVVGIDPAKAVEKLWPDFYDLSSVLVESSQFKSVELFDVLRISSIELPENLLRHIAPILSAVVKNLCLGYYFVRVADVPLPAAKLTEVVGWQLEARADDNKETTIVIGSLLGESQEQSSTAIRGRNLEIYDK